MILPNSMEVKYEYEFVAIFENGSLYLFYNNPYSVGMVVNGKHTINEWLNKVFLTQ